MLKLKQVYPLLLQLPNPATNEKNLVTLHEVVRLPCCSSSLASSSMTWPGLRMVVDISNSSSRLLGRISSGISRARVQGSSVCLLHWRGKK